MADQLINSFPTGSISDNSLGVFGDPTSGALSQTGYKAFKDYFQQGITVNTGSLVGTGSFNAFTSSISGQVNNVFASQSNYTQLSLFDTYTASMAIQVANVFASQSNYETTASFNTYSGSTATTINNVYASESNYTSLVAFNAFTGSDNTRITNVFASQSNYLLTSSYVAGGGSISGSGTISQLAVFNGSTSISASAIYQTTSSTVSIASGSDNGGHTFSLWGAGTMFVSKSIDIDVLGQISGVGGLTLSNRSGGAGLPINFKTNNNTTTIAIFNDAAGGGNKVFSNMAFSASVNIAPGTTSATQLHFDSGSAPTSPKTGDIWFDATGSLKMQVNGATKTFQLL